MGLKRKIVETVKSHKQLYFMYMIIRDIKSYANYRKKGSFSQHGEDVVLQEIFKNKKNGFYIDIGSSHPFRISNTYLLYKNGWNGIAIDPLLHFKLLYKIWRRRDTFLNFGVAEKAGLLTYHDMTPSVLSSFDEQYVGGLVEEGKATINNTYNVEVKNPNDIFDEYVGKEAIDFLSIDVEGLDYRILQSIDFSKYKPLVICVEFNDEQQKKLITTLLTDRGYDCSKIVGCNIFAIENKYLLKEGL